MVLPVLFYLIVKKGLLEFKFILVCYQNMFFFSIQRYQYLFFIAPHIDIALPNLRQEKLSLLTSLLIFLHWFSTLIQGFFSLLLFIQLVLFPLHRSDSFLVSHSERRQQKVIVNLSPLRARKSDNYCLRRDKCKNDNFI